MKTRYLQPFESMALATSFFADLAEADCATATLRHAVVQLLRVFGQSLPQQLVEERFSRRLLQTPEQPEEKLTIELTRDGKFELEWLLRRNGRLVRLSIVLKSGPEPESWFSLIHSQEGPVSQDNIDKIARWVLAHRAEVKARTEPVAA